MWKTDLIATEDSTYISTGSVENVWKNYLPVEKTDEKTVSLYFHRAKYRSTCGNVENFV